MARVNDSNILQCLSQYEEDKEIILLSNLIYKHTLCDSIKPDIFEKEYPFLQIYDFAYVLTGIFEQMKPARVLKAYGIIDENLAVITRSYESGD